MTLTEFADAHGINRNTAEQRWKAGFISGKRESPGKRAPILIEAKGQRDFWVQFHAEPGFRTCDQCPHAM